MLKTSRGKQNSSFFTFLTSSNCSSENQIINSFCSSTRCVSSLATSLTPPLPSHPPLLFLVFLSLLILPLGFCLFSFFSISCYFFLTNVLLIYSKILYVFHFNHRLQLIFLFDHQDRRLSRYSLCMHEFSLSPCHVVDRVYLVILCVRKYLAIFLLDPGNVDVCSVTTPTTSASDSRI